MPYSAPNVIRGFRGTYRCHIQGRRIVHARNQEAASTGWLLPASCLVLASKQLQTAVPMVSASTRMYSGSERHFYAFWADCKFQTFNCHHATELHVIVEVQEDQMGPKLNGAYDFLFMLMMQSHDKVYSLQTLSSTALLVHLNQLLQHWTLWNAIIDSFPHQPH